MSWLELGILLLRLANLIIGEVKRQGAIDEGRRQVIAENLAEVTRKLGVVNEVVARIDKLSESDVDRELRDLERN